MSIALAMALLEKFGPPAVGLIEFLIKKVETSGTLTSVEWADQQAALKLTAADEMLGQLKAAGIDPASPQGVAMIALAK